MQKALKPLNLVIYTFLRGGLVLYKDYNYDSSKELLSYFTKLSDLLIYAERNDKPSLKLGGKKVSVLDLKKDMFTLFDSLKKEMITHHKITNNHFSNEEIEFIEKLSQYKAHTVISEEQEYNKQYSLLQSIFQAFGVLLVLNKGDSQKVMEDLSLFSVASYLSISSSPFDKLDADLEVLHAAERYSEYLKASRPEIYEIKKMSDFENELVSEHGVVDLDIIYE